jgi:peptidoglycan hydrolase-like protein with peptidoglycan-binding domain
LNAAQYLQHLRGCARAAQLIDTVKEAALAGDVNVLMQAPEEVAVAMRALAGAYTGDAVLTLQKDLNVLGAFPSLPEDGVLGENTYAAIKGLQRRFRLQASGDLNGETAFAIRYAVGCIYSQDFAG